MMIALLGWVMAVHRVGTCDQFAQVGFFLTGKLAAGAIVL